MRSLQRLSLILVTLVIISIVIAQSDSAQYISPTETKAQNSKLSDITINGNTNDVNIVQISSAADHVVEIAKTNPLSEQNTSVSSSQQSSTQLVTNIYQTQSGSFYFEDDNQKTITYSDHGQDTNEQYTPSKQRYYLPSLLKNTEANINITGPIARTSITQVFSNPSDTVRSGVYVFPLPQNAAVDHLVMHIEGRKIEGVIKRKQEAKELFKMAKAVGKKAALVSQIRPNIFTNRIANIPPKSEVKVTIEYQQFIVQDKHNYSVRLPLSITPRYAPVGQTLLPQPATLEGEVDIKVRLNTGLPVQEIASEHHPVSVNNRQNTEYHIQLDTEKPANKDFVLNWQVKTGYRVQAAHFTYHQNKHEYGLITLMPPVQDTLSAKRNVMFILDVSGSMVGEALNQAKQALAIAIEDLSEHDQFNVIAFSSEAEALWQSSQQASSDAKNEALSMLYQLEADGGTEIQQALDLAFSFPTLSDNKALDQIVFITDGSVSNEQQLMQTIYNGLGDYRLFTIGIGSAPNAYFMEEAAAVGKGTYTFIGDLQTVKPKMTALLAKIKRPALTNIQLNIKDPKQAFGFEIFPRNIPDLYADEPLIISYKRTIDDSSIHNMPSDSEQAIPFSVMGEFQGFTANGENQWKSELPAISATEETGIHKHWARQKIKDLHRQLNINTRVQHDQRSQQQSALSDKKGIEEAITVVALNHHLVSKFTSLVAIDHHTENNIKAKTNQLVTKSMGAQHVYAVNRLPKTSTTSKLMAILGLFLSLVGASLIFVKHLFTSVSQ
ncbi:VIT domain-containing protein [Glaciecola petra]|uniref:VIT domain-containing protein n=1 Tax=Glaciecola petra TaxID=3075602 RepID=A0ABU2ZVC0_9ALTE|nr:VIT domain-containing protein [Aestuariibacter sp. P117]MDT0596596.1 VIT domain-containing protein [Aestuariibacter sp. P117]